MAFIFQAEKKASIGPTNTSTPGPGQYLSTPEPRPIGYAPFLSTVERGIVKKAKETTPGPGSYSTVLSIENSLKTNKAFHASLSPEQDPVESNNLSTAFKSKTRRFEYKIDTEQPGPGMYYKDGGIGKSKSVSSLHARASVESPAQQIIKEERSVIPSIPSYTHSYGYSEGERRKLVLNKNPLLEIQEFVGPGYYDVKDTMTQNTSKGTTWHKSGTKRFETQAAKLPTNKLGPGSYDQSNVDGAQPKYKSKQSSGFASTTGRTFDKNRSVSGLTKSQSKGAGQFAIGFDIGKLSGMMDGDRGGETDFYTEESLPGPGHYHNEAAISSLKLNYKPTQFQFFGSGTERFRSEPIGAEPLGPGEYNVQAIVAKKLSEATSLSVKNATIEKKEPVVVPFQSTGSRFTTIKTPSLGPGIYDPKSNLVDRVNDKARRGYLGSFGSTEIRFRPKRIPEETPEQTKQREIDLVKQPELTEEQKKASHVFVSRTNKVTNSHKPPEMPPPGAYDVNYYDMASKFTKDDGYFYNPKKTAFNSTDSRFKYPEPEATEPGSEEQRYVPRRNVVKMNLKNSPSSVFTSQTKRATSCIPRNGMPGPGAYQSLSQAGWLKKSFNIKFLDP